MVKVHPKKTTKPSECVNDIASIPVSGPEAPIHQF